MQVNRILKASTCNVKNDKRTICKTDFIGTVRFLCKWLVVSS